MAEVGDVVVVKTNGRRAELKAILPNINDGAPPIYVLRYRRGGSRTCLYREEFDVVIA